jgi:hypothetical protein
MEGSQEHRLPHVVAKRAADFGDQHGEAAVRHEGARPELSVDVELGHCGRSLLDKQCEKIERFRRKVDWAASVQQLPRRGVESECTESDAQNDLRSGRGTKRILIPS